MKDLAFAFVDFTDELDNPERLKELWEETYFHINKITELMNQFYKEYEGIDDNVVIVIIDMTAKTEEEIERDIYNAHLKHGYPPDLAKKETEKLMESVREDLEERDKLLNKQLNRKVNKKYDN